MTAIPLPSVFSDGLIWQSLKLQTPPKRNPIQIYDSMTRIGLPYAVVDPKKVIGIVESDEPDYLAEFTPPDRISQRIAEHVVNFLIDEMRVGRIPETFLPLQAGVGNVANGVMAALGAHPDIPDFKMYSEVLQDSIVDLITEGRLVGASATSLTVTSEKLRQIVDNFDFYVPRIVLRPQEISNHPAYRDYLERYVKESRVAHIRHDLVKCFELHRNLIEYGAMLPDLDTKDLTF